MTEELRRCVLSHRGG